MNIIERAKAPTPKFFRTLRSIGLTLLAVSGSVLAATSYTYSFFACPTFRHAQGNQIELFINFFAAPKKLQKKSPQPMYFQLHWNRFKKLAINRYAVYEYHRAF
ncbi:MAG: hypothetical protein KGZ87_05295 [Bacteroidetes bacterium]|nr:hypothetical protein [Bacteroidota bacterium]